MSTRQRKIYATRKWLIEQSGEVAKQRYLDSARLHDAMKHIVEALCQCAFANHYAEGLWFAKTTDGMEWSVKFEKMGKRNPKTGKIDKRIKQL